jgi:hypothetical protein
MLSHFLSHSLSFFSLSVSLSTYLSLILGTQKLCLTERRWGGLFYPLFSKSATSGFYYEGTLG